MKCESRMQQGAASGVHLWGHGLRAPSAFY
jgi:hypothetical protein